MIFYFLKVFHIFCATLMLVGMTYCFAIWRKKIDNSMGSMIIQQQTWRIIIPFALLQLFTGFTMISVKHEDLSQIWITGSIVGFITLIGSWLGFVYFLTELSQARRLQAGFLLLSGFALLSMVFLMANKIS